MHSPRKSKRSGPLLHQRLLRRAREERQIEAREHGQDGAPRDGALTPSPDPDWRLP